MAWGEISLIFDTKVRYIAFDTLAGTSVCNLCQAGSYGSDSGMETWVGAWRQRDAGESILLRDFFVLFCAVCHSLVECWLELMMLSLRKSCATA